LKIEGTRWWVNKFNEIGSIDEENGSCLQEDVVMVKGKCSSKWTKLEQCSSQHQIPQLKTAP
jgi:hypothetical protein